MNAAEIIERSQTKKDFSNQEWQNGFVHGVDGTSPRRETEEYKNGYAHGCMADTE